MIFDMSRLMLINTTAIFDLYSTELFSSSLTCILNITVLDPSVKVYRGITKS